MKTTLKTLAFLLLFPIWNTAYAQFPGYNYAQGYTPPSSPTIINYKSDYQFERERVLAMMATRRHDRHLEWERGRSFNAIKSYTPEDRALSKYRLAQQLFYNGKPEASKRWLEELVNLFPDTFTADRARLVLTRF